MYQSRVAMGRRPNKGGWKQELFDPRRRMVFLLAIGLVCIVATFFVLIFHSTMDFEDHDTLSKTISEAVKAHPAVLNIKAKPPTHSANIVNEIPVLDERNRLIAEEEALNARRRDAISSTFKSLWTNYSNHCLSDASSASTKKECSDWFGQNLVRVDALDALWLFGMKTEFMESQRWIERELHFDHPNYVSLAETSTRLLGGLLSAFDMSNRPIFLEKAKKLADRLLPSLEKSRVGLPLPLVDLQSGSTKNHDRLKEALLLGEIGAFQLEFSFISHHTNEPIYAQRALQVLKLIQKHPFKDKPGLYATHVDGTTGNPWSMTVTLNPPADTFFHNLFKLHMMFTRRVRWISDMWSDVAKAVLENLATRSGSFAFPKTLIFGEDATETIGGTKSAAKSDENSNTKVHRIHSSSCTSAGNFAVYSQTVDDPELSKAAFAFGEGYTALCAEIQQQSESGIASEFVSVHNDAKLEIAPGKDGDLRVEIAEAIFYLSRVTGDPKYRQWTWNFFEGLSHRFGLGKPSSGSSSRSVRADNGSKSSKHEIIDVTTMRRLIHAFKVLFLTFHEDPDLLPIKRYVLNAEGHPFAIFKPDPALYT